MKQLEVHIMQQSYMLGCPEGQEARLMSAVKHVDEAMSGIRDSGKIRGRERIAVLAALNLAYEVADRDAAAASVPVPAVAEAPAGTATEERLAQLLARLDAALGEQTPAL